MHLQARHLTFEEVKGHQWPRVTACLPCLLAKSVTRHRSFALAWAHPNGECSPRVISAVENSRFKGFIFNRVDSAHVNVFACGQERWPVHSYLHRKTAAKSYLMTHLNPLMRIQARMDWDWRAAND
jgi:hypothetical protein